MGKGKRLALAKKRNAAMEVIIRPLIAAAKVGRMMSVCEEMGKQVMSSLSNDSERRIFCNTLVETSAHIMFELNGAAFQADKPIVNSHAKWMKQYGYLFKEDDGE